MIVNFFTFSDVFFTVPLLQILSILCIACTTLYVAKSLFNKIDFFSFVIYQFKHYTNKKFSITKIIINFIIISLLYTIMFLTTEGHSIILEFAINNLRVLIAVSFLWALAFYTISLSSKSLYYVFYSGFCVFCFSISYNSGNFLKNQDQYFNMIMTNINYDISHNQYSSKIKIIALNPFPLSESNKRLTARNPLFLHLYGEQDFDWLTASKMSNILPYYPSTNSKEMCKLINTIHSNQQPMFKIIKGDTYTLYFQKDNVLIDFYTNQKTKYCN